MWSVECGVRSVFQLLTNKMWGHTLCMPETAGMPLAWQNSRNVPRMGGHRQAMPPTPCWRTKCRRHHPYILLHPRRMNTPTLSQAYLSEFFNGNFVQRKISFWRAGCAFCNPFLPLLAPPSPCHYPFAYPAFLPQTRSTAVPFSVYGAAVYCGRPCRATSTAPPSS